MDIGVDGGVVTVRASMAVRWPASMHATLDGRGDPAQIRRRIRTDALARRHLTQPTSPYAWSGAWLPRSDATCAERATPRAGFIVTRPPKGFR